MVKEKTWDDILYTGLLSCCIVWVLRLFLAGVWWMVFHIFSEKAIKIIIKISGIIFGLFVLTVMVLIAMQLYSIIGGTNADTSNIFQGSFFRLDYIFENNPIKDTWNL